MGDFRCPVSYFAATVACTRLPLRPADVRRGRPAASAVLLCSRVFCVFRVAVSNRTVLCFSALQGEFLDEGEEDEDDEGEEEGEDGDDDEEDEEYDDQEYSKVGTAMWGDEEVEFEVTLSSKKKYCAPPPPAPSPPSSNHYILLNVALVSPVVMKYSLSSRPIVMCPLFFFWSRIMGV